MTSPLGVGLPAPAGALVDLIMVCLFGIYDASEIFGCSEIYLLGWIGWGKGKGLGWVGTASDYRGIITKTKTNRGVKGWYTPNKTFSGKKSFPEIGRGNCPGRPGMPPQI